MTGKALVFVSIVLSATPTLAHHSFAMFDQSKLVQMQGTVTQFEFVNPHAWLHLAFANDKGEASTWSFEAGSVAQLVKLG